jgi:hypothetical protein
MISLLNINDAHPYGFYASLHKNGNFNCNNSNLAGQKQETGMACVVIN